VPLVHSVSYGWQGDLSKIGCKPADLTVVDANLAKLAAKGISIMVSSGDSGSGYTAPHSSQCQQPEGGGSNGEALVGDIKTTKGVQEAFECCQLAGSEPGWTFVPGKRRRDGKCTVYKTVTSNTTASSSTISGRGGAYPKLVLYPSWPASSPWVTSVGATRFVGQTVGSEEMATDQFGSGGGFSSQFAQSPNAEWQSAAVAKYLTTVDPSTLPPADSFPAMGRATPDVSALGEGYQVFVNGKAESVGGTSASSPAFASMVSLLNEARLNAGKPAMGFLNPFLYKNADAFTDVVKGSNKFGRGGDTLPYGYNCSAGWDPATGLGTPKFDKLLAAAMA
jgi:subtilase family serine protease